MISCKCITAGRVESLEESLYSFLIQSRDAEMVIVNDYPEQILEFKHPRVRVYNVEPFDTIGEKENFALSLCRGETIAVWDDDDIALSNHIENIETYFMGGVMHWNRGIFLNGDKATITSLGNSGIVYERRLWGEIPHFGNAGYDMDFVMKCKKIAPSYSVSPKKPSWIYRWGNGVYHMSGLGADTPDRDNVVIRHRKYLEELKEQGMIPTGKIYLNPHWKIDYSKIIKL